MRPLWLPACRSSSGGDASPNEEATSRNTAEDEAKKAEGFEEAGEQCANRPKLTFAGETVQSTKQQSRAEPENKVPQKTENEISERKLQQKSDQDRNELEESEPKAVAVRGSGRAADGARAPETQMGRRAVKHLVSPTDLPGNMSMKGGAAKMFCGTFSCCGSTSDSTTAEAQDC